MTREIGTVRQSLRTLDRSLGNLIPILSATMRNGAEAERTSRRPRLSSKARASLVLQGRYMGYMRQLKPRQKAQVRKVKETRGVRAAIAKARGLSQASS